MLQEEFSRLIYLFQQATEGKNIPVEEVFHKSLEFIEHLKEQIRTGDEEDKKAAIRMMNELYKYMKNHTKMVCEKAGITEEQLLASSENPANFTPEQWARMQETKEQLTQSGRQIIQLIQKDKSAPEEQPPSAEKKEQKKRKGKKSQWMRS
jgi:hypothetical protein